MAIISIEDEEVSAQLLVFSSANYDVCQIITKPTDAAINDVKSSNRALVEQVKDVRFLMNTPL